MQNTKRSFDYCKKDSPISCEIKCRCLDTDINVESTIWVYMIEEYTYHCGQYSARYIR